MYPDKTFVGRWRKGLEFLGMRIEEAMAKPLADAEHEQPGQDYVTLTLAIQKGTPNMPHFTQRYPTRTTHPAVRAVETSPFHARLRLANNIPGRLD